MIKDQEQIKVIVVGDSGVGKSSLLLRFINNEFDEFQQSTLGASFLSKIFEFKPGKKIVYQIWDTAGQEKYKSIASVYYQDAQVALCMYDITRKNSFTVLRKWVQQLKSKGPQNILLAVVGNKIDMSQQQQIPYTEGKQYAQQINAIFKLTSAKENKGIDDLFTTIALKLIQQKSARPPPPRRQTLKLNQVSQQTKQKTQKKKKCQC